MSLFTSRKKAAENVAGPAEPLVRTPTQQAWIRFRKNQLAMAGAGMLVVLVLFVFVGCLVTPYDPDMVDLTLIRAKPSAGHWLGCDDLGRDLLTRLLFGGRISLAVGLASALLSMTLGSFIGAIAGFFGGWVDSLMMQLTDLVLTIPSLPLLMVVGAVFKPSPMFLVVMISVLNWTKTARLVRSRFLTLRTLDYTKAARAIGAKDGRIILHHLLPNSLGAIIVTATLAVGRSIIMESTLSYLGCGINPPTASWGNMLQGAQSTMTTAPLTAIAPGAMILLTVLAFNFLGDGLDDAIDPKRSR